MSEEHSEDIYECGDYRKEHVDNGECKLNGLGHGMPSGDGRCEQFRLTYSQLANYEPYDEILEEYNAAL